MWGDIARNTCSPSLLIGTGLSSPSTDSSRLLFCGKSEKFNVQSSAIGLEASRSSTTFSERILSTSRTDAARFLVEATPFATVVTLSVTVGWMEAAARASGCRGCWDDLWIGDCGDCGAELRTAMRGARRDSRDERASSRV